MESSGQSSFRGRSWVFTLNNYTEDDITSLKSLAVVYLIFGKEVGESGTPHLQGYVYYLNKKSHKQVCKDIPRAFVEFAKGSPQDNTTYCSKQGDVFIKGEEPHQGKRSDLEAIVTDIKINNPSFSQILHEHTSVVARYPGFVHTCRRTFHPPGIRDVLDNEWHYGETGLGKTRGVWASYPGLYVKDAKSKWWDGYDSEEVVLIDEVDLECKSLAGVYKVWTDHYPFNAEVKNGYIKIRPRKVIFTSNWSIQELFPNPNDHIPLLRRFRVIHHQRLAERDES